MMPAKAGYKLAAWRLFCSYSKVAAEFHHRLDRNARFPLTPALSLGERESRAAARGEWEIAGFVPAHRRSTELPNPRNANHSDADTNHDEYPSLRHSAEWFSL